MNWRSSLSRALFFAFTLLFNKGFTQEKSRPNIVFIFSDDHAYQAVSAYNGMLAKLAPTPNIDRIASQGLPICQTYSAARRE